MEKSWIVFRLDDICDTMNIGRFFQMKELLDRYDIKPLLGIVPLNEDRTLVMNEPYHNFLELMHSCKNSGWSIAMHGTHHLYDTAVKGIATRRPKSEFAGKALAEQISLIKEGREKMIADGLYTDIFFAPGHSYDRNTIFALKDCGFHVISDGRTRQNYQWKGMNFVPVRHYGLYMEPGGQITTMCFHLNNMDEQDFDKTEKYIVKHIENIISFDEAKVLPKCNTSIALADERIFVFYEYTIHPILSTVKRKIFGRKL